MTNKQKEQMALQHKHNLEMIYIFVFGLFIGGLYFMWFDGYNNSLINAHSDFVQRGCVELQPKEAKQCWDDIVSSAKTKNRTRNLNHK